nr:unnamed protein product [Digitaria exilis]
MGRGRWAPGIRAAALVLLAVAAAARVAVGDPDPDELERAFPIVEPDYGHTKLRLSEQGLEAIRRIENPIAIVGVIGPYRSGKSFLLNQLLSLSCDKGFGVGHMRDTKTKGVWIWGTPVEMDVDGSKVSVLYLDTEGFESVGKSNVYDDRIFALATVLSSVLIYNLPETVREADISRLSFAVEIAEEFYGRGKTSLLSQQSFSGLSREISSVSFFWNEGKSVQQMVNEALQRVPNDNGDKYIDEPHLQRTKLCDMEDKELEPLYVKRREELKQLVASIIKPKIVQGKTLNGRDFVSFLQQILEALNKGEIPSTGSLVEIFNKAILERCLKAYRDKMDGLGLPVTVEKLQQVHEMANDEARVIFDKQHFGKHHAAQSLLKLEDEIKKMLAKSRALFIKEYNNKLFNWLVTFSLVMVVVGRFVIKFFLLEIVAWVMFIFLETYTRMFWSAESLYYNPAWHIIVSSWETIVYSPILDLDRWAIPIVIMLAFGVLYWRCFGGRRKRGRGSLLPLYKNSYNKNATRPRSD